MIKIKEKKAIINFIYLTLFPDYFKNYFQLSIAKEATKKKKLSYIIYNLRDFAKKRKVDDYIFGGGSGMLLKIEPLVEALKEISKNYPKNYIIFLSPQGKKFTQKDVKRLIKKKNLVFISGHYEGVDARIWHFIDEQISIGNFITTGGELPSLVITDCIIRAIPGVIKKESYEKETFSNKKFDFDSYTRPRLYENLTVPNILVSGNHKKIEEWREKNIEEKEKKPKKLHKNKKKIRV